MAKACSATASSGCCAKVSAKPPPNAAAQRLRCCSSPNRRRSTPLPALNRASAPFSPKRGGKRNRAKSKADLEGAAQNGALSVRQSVFDAPDRLLSEKFFQADVHVPPHLFAVYVGGDQQPRRAGRHPAGELAHFALQSLCERGLRSRARKLF